MISHSAIHGSDLECNVFHFPKDIGKQCRRLIIPTSWSPPLSGILRLITLSKLDSEYLDQNYVVRVGEWQVFSYYNIIFSISHSVSILVQLLMRTFLHSFLPSFSPSFLPSFLLLYIQSVVILNCTSTRSYLYSKYSSLFVSICGCGTSVNYPNTCHLDRWIICKDSLLTNMSYLLCSTVNPEALQIAEGEAQGGQGSPGWSQLESIPGAILLFRWWNGVAEIVSPSGQATAHSSSLPSLERAI